jgi:hypothetical protein
MLQGVHKQAGHRVSVGYKQGIKMAWCFTSRVMSISQSVHEQVRKSSNSKHIAFVQN